MSDFSRSLSGARVRAGLSQAELARAIRVSVATIGSWETGRRRPNWQARPRVIEAADLLGLSASDLNDMLISVGLSPVPAGRLAPLLDRRKPLAVLQSECRSYRWPTLAMNEDFEVVAWNDAANDLSELDFATDLAEPGARHLLRMALSDHYAPRMQNWDEVIGIMVGMWKTTGFDPLSPAHSTPYFEHLMAYILANHPADLARLLTIWQSISPHSEGQRVVFNVSWLTGEKLPLRFNCEFTAWSDFDAVAAFDWHPADAATWRWLESRRQRRLAHDPAVPESEDQVRRGSARDLLRWARERCGLTRRELGDRAELSADIVYSLEAGRKSMTEPTLLKLGHAMALNAVDLNTLLDAAGFEPRASDQYAYILGYDVSGSTRYGRSLERRMNWTPDDTAREIESYEWPVLVVNERCEVICVNRPADLVLGPALGRLGPGPERNLFALVTDEPFRRATRNWETVVANVLPGNLEAYMTPPGIDRSAAKDDAYFASVVDLVRRREIAAGRGDEVIRRTFTAWRAKPNRRLTARIAFEMHWENDSARLLFDVVITPWNAMRDPYWAIELHPGDAGTWDFLTRDGWNVG